MICGLGACFYRRRCGTAPALRGGEISTNAGKAKQTLRQCRPDPTSGNGCWIRAYYTLFFRRRVNRNKATSHSQRQHVRSGRIKLKSRSVLSLLSRAQGLGPLWVGLVPRGAPASCQRPTAPPRPQRRRCSLDQRRLLTTPAGAAVLCCWKGPRAAGTGLWQTAGRQASPASPACVARDTCHR